MRISDWSSDVCSSDLTLLAGAPAVVGLWIGSLAYAPQWTALFLGIGAGAIAQVIVEVTLYMTRTGKGRGTLDRKSVVYGKSVSVRVDLGGRRIIKKKNKIASNEKAKSTKHKET